jgi:hypothetical protein
MTEMQADIQELFPLYQFYPAHFKYDRNLSRARNNVFALHPYEIHPDQ